MQAVKWEVAEASEQNMRVPQGRGEVPKGYGEAGGGLGNSNTVYIRGPQPPGCSLVPGYGPLGIGPHK